MLYCHQPVPSPGSHKGAQARRVFRAGRAFTHLMADSEIELVGYAESIGLRREWLQDRGTWRAHFDVTGAKLERVLHDPRVLVLGRAGWLTWLANRAKTWASSRHSLSSGSAYSPSSSARSD